jgi:hypothetical protein
MYQYGVIIINKKKKMILNFVLFFWELQLGFKAFAIQEVYEEIQCGMVGLFFSSDCFGNSFSTICT